MENAHYLDEVIGGRDRIEWFTDAPTADDAVAGPADVYLRTESGDVTWGWAIEPVPLDPGERTFRRLRHPDGWAFLVDADDPELIAVDAPLDVHTVAGGPTGVAVVLSHGSVPDMGSALDLARASHQAPGARYTLSPGWPLDHVSDALGVWIAAMLGREVEVVHRDADESDLESIRGLTAGVDSGIETSNEPPGFDEEILELLEPWESLVWFQSDLSWPDEAGRAAFRDRVDVRARDESGAVNWLAVIEPPSGDEDLVWWPGPDGSPVGFDPFDPSRIILGFDRVVLAVSRQSDGYEPSGVAVPVGQAPSTEQWASLRAALHDDAILTYAPAWGEDAVSDALSVWAEAWSGLDLEFEYDFEDPAVAAVQDANDALAETPPLAPSIRTATASRCAHRAEPSGPFEDPLPCGRRATHYFTDAGGDIVAVCEEHVPPGVKATALLRA
jgi:hypothetical protein